MADARHYTYYDGGDYPFAGTTSGLIDGSGAGQHVLTLERQVVWELDLGSGSSLRSAARLTNGNTVVTDGAGRVTEYRQDKTVVWSYGPADDPTLATPSSAQRLENGNTLICDDTGRRVIEVDAGKTIVWSYTSSDNPDLSGPSGARRLSNGNTLIADAAGGKVLEVTPGKSEEVIWSSGSGAPRDATRLADGSTLVVDESGHTVFVVGAGGDITWRFGAAGVADDDDMHLNAPTSAQRLADGSTVIADTGNGRTLRVTSGGTVIDVLDAAALGGSLGLGAGAVVTPRGTQLVADGSGHRLLEVGYATSGTYSTQGIVFGLAGVNKWITRIARNASMPSGTSIRAEYRFDNGTWRSAGTAPAYDVTSSTPFDVVELRFTLSTTDAGVSPLLKGWNATYYLAKPTVFIGKGSGTGSGSGKGAGSGSSKGTGTGSGAGRGTGTGTGTGSTGNGSGTGTGTGTGSGSGSGSGTGTGTGTGTGMGTMTAIATGVTAEEADGIVSGQVLNEKAGGTGGGGGPAAQSTQSLVAALALVASAYLTGIGSTSLGRSLHRGSRYVRATIPAVLRP